jgi:hypothetical protein
MRGHYQNEKEIEEVVEDFESCTTGVDNFKHREHLAVAVWYLRNSSQEEAFQKMCAGLLRFLDHHGVSREPYNEELTRSWINLIQRTLDELDPELSLMDATNTVVERLGDKRAVLNDPGKS